MAARILAAVAALAMSASTQTISPAEFEVATIKLNPSCGGGRGGNPTPGRLDLECQTLENLIQTAYGAFAKPVPNLQRLRIRGLPTWATSDRYNITAKATTAAPAVWQIFGPMLQKLLEERFALKLHREAREGAVYEMIIAKGEFKGTATPQGSCISLDVGLDRIVRVPTLGVRPRNLVDCGVKLSTSIRCALS
jgi:uncharacterized protein (TIGR03435 family)